MLLSTLSSASGYTREEVMKRGVLHCGVSPGTQGFSTVDVDGNWRGMDIDICRAVAAATLGDAAKVEYMPLAADEAFTALLSGSVDILSRHSIWTYTSDSALAVHFAGIFYYDGQGFLVAESLDVKKAAEIRKVKVCSPVGLAANNNLADYFRENKVDYKLVPYESLDLAIKGFQSSGCELLSLPKSQLYGIYHELNEPKNSILLPEVITKDPFGPVVRQGDDVWFNIVRWVMFALVDAEELGIRSDNIAEMKISNRLDVKRFFGLEGSGGTGLGLADDWAAQVVGQVGNYGELFDRNLGGGSVLQIERGMNKLWRDGGLMYSPPIR